MPMLMPSTAASAKPANRRDSVTTHWERNCASASNAQSRSSTVCGAGRSAAGANPKVASTNQSVTMSASGTVPAAASVSRARAALTSSPQ
jgi:hypothetical protein